MSDFIKVKHSFNAGDLLCILPGLRQIWKDKGKKAIIFQRIGLPAFYYDNSIIGTTDKDGISVTMNEELFFRLKPLIEAQEYIEGFEMWKGEAVDMDYDLTRDSRMIPMPSGTIHSWGETMFPQTSTDLSEPWITVNTDSISKQTYKGKIIINRTQRYQNPYITYYFLKEYQERLLFSGTEVEHTAFCTQWDLQIPLIKTDNFYQLCQILQWCKGGIFNQSLHFHLGDAQKSRRILELCPAFPNTFVTGIGGNQFYHQKSLEHHFNKLINEN